MDYTEFKNLYFKAHTSVTEDEISGEPEEGFQNWARTINFTPEKTFYPEDCESLKHIVKEAKKSNKKIRCASQKYTWSSLSVTKDWLVILDDNLSKIEVNYSNNNGWVVIAEAGAQISEINKYLRNNDPPLTMVSMTVPDSPRIGGIIATGSHGAKIEAGLFSDQVVCLEIVTSSGTVRKFDDSKPDEMAAARVNLGLLGIIYKVTMLVKPMYYLRVKDIYPKLDCFTHEDIKDLVKDSNTDGIQIFYWPFNRGYIASSDQSDSSKDRFWIKIWEEVSPIEALKEEPSLTPEKVKEFYESQIKFSYMANNESFGYPTVLDKPDNTPSTTRNFGILKREMFDDVVNYRVWEVPDAYHFQAGIENVLCRALEFAIKADKDFKNVMEELNFIVKRIYQEKDKKRFPINLAVELRILKSSKALLSNSYDEDPDAYYFFIEVVSYRYYDNIGMDTQYFKEFSHELAERWIKKYNARPHWAKEWEDVPDIRKYLHKSLKERIQKFEEVRNECDPDDLDGHGPMFFDNESLREIFYGSR